MIGMSVERSPRAWARIAGVLSLLTILGGVFSEMLVSGRLVTDDAAVTAGNILAHRGLVQLGFAVYMIEMACNVATIAIMYDLFKPVSRTVSLLAAFLGLAGCVIKTTGRLFFAAPLFVLSGDHYLDSFNPAQLQALALLLLKLNSKAAAMGLAFFGFYALAKSYVLYRASFLPRIFGVLSFVCGLGWLTFLWPPLANRALPIILPVGLLAALAQIAWLIIVGVNEERWKAQAAASRRASLEER